MNDSNHPQNTGRNVLVIGASGSFGAAVARELVARGWNVHALRRPGGRPLKIRGVSDIEGDAENAEDVSRATQNVDVVVYGYNVPYQQWLKKLLPAADNVARAAERHGLTIVFPGNVYGLGADFSKPLNEECTRDAVSIKGQLRNQVEARLERATRKGARLLIVRCGDYFGPDATHSSWFSYMTKGAQRGGALTNLAPNEVPHEWAYLPDVALATAELLERRERLGPCEVFHFSSYQVTSGQMLEAIQYHLGKRRIKRMPWGLLRWLKPFVPLVREVFDVRYLWDKPVLLDDSKLRTLLPDLTRTPLHEAVRQTLQASSSSETARSQHRAAAET